MTESLPHYQALRIELEQMWGDDVSPDPSAAGPERVALALSDSDEALRAIEAATARKRHPTMILAALHDLTLAGRAPAHARRADLDLMAVPALQ